MTRFFVCLLLMLTPLSAMAETVRVGIFVGNDIGFGQDEQLGHASTLDEHDQQLIEASKQNLEKQIHRRRTLVMPSRARPSSNVPARST